MKLNHQAIFYKLNFVRRNFDLKLKTLKTLQVVVVHGVERDPRNSEISARIEGTHQ